MLWIDKKELELRRLWKRAQIATGDYKQDLLRVFWKEYRHLRKTKKFQKEIKNQPIAKEPYVTA